MTPRERIAAAIERRAVERGRHLTVREQLENLATALAADADTPCPLCGARDDEMCEWVKDGEACKLEMNT